METNNKQEYNFIILTKEWINSSDFNKKCLFSMFDATDEIQYLSVPIDMYDILVKCGIFKSKTDAKNNWKKTEKEIPNGFNDFERIGKLNKRITIYNQLKNLDN